VDEKDNSTKPKRTRVLRAADVMPPFDKLPEGAGVAGTGGSAGVDGGLAAEATPDAGLSQVGDVEVPVYDLAENILAEQRRVAARRRRSPSQTQVERVAVPQSAGVRSSLAELPSDDLPELQRIVAEIVARDIDRLCRRPAR
jgi:hypothetical protein